MTSRSDPGTLPSAADAADAADISYYRPRVRVRVRRNTENVRHPRHPRQRVDRQRSSWGGRPTAQAYECRDPERVKREGWREQGVLLVAEDDRSLTWPKHELVRQLGAKLFGSRLAKEAIHG
jgi:hypothetical protein